ncbi:hypothetical protein OA58_24650 [Microcystis aeruginosa NIES-88]|nr:hypothetical protein OA58_24650 [Microcystis aeruginosa NIES-88]
MYPELTENLAAKQFLIDQLDAGLDDNLDNDLDDKLKILIEKSLGDRLDATEKSISKWILAFDDRIKDIDREMKDRSIAIDHQIKAIEARLDESLDKTLDNSLDENLDSSLYESYSEIFIDSPDENLDDSLDTKLDDTLDDSLDKSLDDATIDKKHGQSIEPAIEQWLTLKEILGQRRKDWPKSIEGLRKKAIREGWPRRDRENRKEYQIP